MKCVYCNAEIKENAKFCTKCGKEQKKVEPPQEAAPLFCKKCGAKLKPGAKFCTGCGAEVAPASVAGSEPAGKPKQPEQAAKPQQPKQPVNNPQPEKHNGKIIVAVVIAVLCVCVIVAGGVVGFIVVKGHIEKQNRVTVSDNKDKDDEDDEDEKDKDDKNDGKDDDKEVTTEKAQEEDKTKKTEEIDPSEADYDLTKNDYLSLEGNILDSAGEGKVLKLKKVVKIYGEDETGEETLVENITNVVIDGKILPKGMLDDLENNLAVTIEGDVSIKKGKIYVAAEEITNSKGKDLIAAFESKDDDYVIPESSDEYLTYDDIKDLTLQEVNYAKNEIYARHGRKFDAKELQDYFGSKSWYKGTIDPSKFNENVFSKVEKANIKLLKDREFEMDPKGYKLY